jgi:hypothetical protein
MEQWAPIPRLDGYYEASDRGRIRRAKPGMNTFVGRFVKLAWHPNGYVQAVTCIEGKEQRHWVHRLVAAAFLDNDLEGKHVHHIDGDSSNNRLENLEVLTPRQHRHCAVSAAMEALRGQVKRWRQRERT